MAARAAPPASSKSHCLPWAAAGHAARLFGRSSWAWLSSQAGTLICLIIYCSLTVPSSYQLSAMALLMATRL